MKNKSRFFVVIHALTNNTLNKGWIHILEESRTAKREGAHGVIIIPDYEKGEKKANFSDMVQYMKRLKEANSDEFLIGVNFLNTNDAAVEALYELQPDIVQCDGVFSSKLHREKFPTTEFFCGVAFKYSKNVHLSGDLLRNHCIEIASKCDVPTTSGDATAQAADLGKIREIRSYLPEEKRFGIASGVTVDNVRDYLQAGVTDFLVASSLINTIDASGFDLLDSKKIHEMSLLIRS